MVKDFTDYVVMIFGSGERVYQLYHYRTNPEIVKRSEADKLIVKLPPNGFQGHRYKFDINRAYSLQWVSWSYFKSKNPVKFLPEIFRSKRIGYLFYQEPTNYKNWDYKEGEEKPIEPMHISRIHQPSGRLEEHGN